MTASETLFELWDGGHCYLRATRDSDNMIELVRFPTRASVALIGALAAWSMGASEEAVRRCIPSLIPGP